MIPNSPTYIKTLAFITASLAWGTTFAAMKVAVETIPPFLLAVGRFTLAGAVILVVLRLRGVAWPSRTDWPRIAVVGILMLALANPFICWAESYVDSSFAALAVNIGPLMFVVMAALFGQRVPRMAWIGLVVGLGGVAVLCGRDLGGALDGSFEPHPNFWWAMGALFASPLLWAIGSIYHTRRPVACSHLMMVACQNIAGGVAALPLALIFGEHLRAGPPSRESLLAAVWLLVVGSWMGYMAYMYCVLHFPAHRTASTMYINNVIAVLVGCFVLGEVFTWNLAVGGLTIIIGVWMANTARLRRAGPPLAESAGHRAR